MFAREPSIVAYVLAAMDFVVCLVASGHVLLFKRNTRAAIGWIGLIWLSPIPGATLYLLLGINRIHRRARTLRRGRVHPAALPAALIAHGTNLGIAAMGHSAEGITVDMLQHVSRWFLREETLRAANAVLVDYHSRLDLSAVWGDGSRSSSDGQRFGVQAGSLLGALYPRYFGYYDRAVTVYTHTSDQHSVFGTRAISCSARGAVRAGRPSGERHDPAAS